MFTILAIALLAPLLHILVAVLVGLLICYCVGLFLGSQPQIMTIVQIIVGLVILIYSLSLFGVSF